MAPALNTAETKSDIAAAMAEIGRAAKAAARVLAIAPAEQKNRALTAMAAAIRSEKAAILSANAEDMTGGKAAGLTSSFLDRLELNDKRIEAMAKAGAKIASHVNTELWMTQEIIHDWEKKVFSPRAKEALPTDTFYTATRKTTFAGEPIEYGLLPMAHTDGDIYVYFKQSNVLMAGDAVQPGKLPLLDWPTGGWIGGMQDAQRTLLSLANDSTKIVPASGPVMTKAELQMSLDLVTKVREHLVKLVKQGMGPQDLIAAKAMKDFEGQLAGDPEPFLYTAYRGLYAHARELGGVI